MLLRTFLCIALLAALASPAQSRGVTSYLPLNLLPEVERQIERVMILGDVPVMTRPIPAAALLEALPKACEVDPVLCAEVRHYLEEYMHTAGLEALTLEAAGSSGVATTLANQRGMRSNSAWRAAAALYWQPSDYLLINLGGVAYNGEATPAGSYVSMGFSFAQLDIGYRDHWLSPFSDSSMLLSTQAPSMPSATLSNYAPLTRLKLHYELSLARLSTSDKIEFQDQRSTGRPQLAGLHLSMQPAEGWSLGFNRLLQYGGGARGGVSASELFRAFFLPSRFDNEGDDLSRDDEFGNQLASITSRFIFPGRTPFSVYLEYGGEDTSNTKNYLLGNSALSAGIEFPRLWKNFDLAYEVSEWQNGWYVNHLYGDGLSNRGHVLGHWGGDQRVVSDGVGAQSHMVRAGWHAPFGGSMQLRYRTLDNQSYSPANYQRAHDLSLRYARTLQFVSVGAEATAGRDVFGDSFSRFSLFVSMPARGEIPFTEALPDREAADGAELFIDAGVNANRVVADIVRESPRVKSSQGAAPHLGLGARRAVSARNDLGVRMELDEIDGRLLVGFRALDYRHRFGEKLAASAFLGAARYDLSTPAYGVYGGVGAQWRNLLPGWDLGLDLRYAAKVARDRLLASDPQSARPDLFYDISSATLYLSRRF